MKIQGSIPVVKKECPCIDIVNLHMLCPPVQTYLAAVSLRDQPGKATSRPGGVLSSIWMNDKQKEIQTLQVAN